ncbi:MAG: serine hydrolase domain-containing protein, partial [Candidatus Thorarchaeota archaeon]
PRILPKTVSKMITELEEKIPESMKESNIPGFSISIVDKDGIVWSKGFGHTDREKSKEVNPETLFMIGSLSKIYTVTVFLRMMQKGLVHLDDKLIEYYPEFTWNTRFGVDEREKITFRHLLTHYAGLQHNGRVHKDDGTVDSFENYIENIGNTWQKYPVGTRLSYSNLGFDMVAFVLERISGKKFEDLMNEEVYEPLGMTQSSTNASIALATHNAAVGYNKDDSIPLNQASVPQFGSGSQISCVKDMSKFLMLHFNKGHIDDVEYLSEELLEEIYTIPFAEDYQLAAIGMGIGVGKFRHGGELKLSFLGDGPGYIGFHQFLPELGIGWLMQCNQVSGGYPFMIEIMQNIQKTLLEWKMGKIPDDLTVNESINLPPEVQLDASLLDRLSGKYISRMMDIIVSPENENLTFSFKGKQVILQSHSNYQFSSEGLPLVEFTFDESKRPLTIKLVESDGDITVLDYDSGPADIEGPNKSEWQQYLKQYSFEWAGFRLYSRPTIKNGDLFLKTTMNSKEYRLYEIGNGVFFTADGSNVTFKDDEFVIDGITWTVDDTSVDTIQKLASSDPDDIRVKEQSLSEFSEILEKMGQVDDAKVVDELKNKLYSKA